MNQEVYIDLYPKTVKVMLSDAVWVNITITCTLPYQYGSFPKEASRILWRSVPGAADKQRVVESSERSEKCLRFLGTDH